MGVRISCLILARNIELALVGANAASRPSTNSCSPRLRSVMSRKYQTRSPLGPSGPITGTELRSRVRLSLSRILSWLVAKVGSHSHDPRSQFTRSLGGGEKLAVALMHRFYREQVILLKDL
jgi:hypothetical protein